MKFLVDASQSPLVARLLTQAGHDAVHVFDLGLGRASDDALLTYAAHDGRVIVSADADFPMLLAHSGASSPSVILLRSSDKLTPVQQALLIQANLQAADADLTAGAVLSLRRGRLRIRRLPLPGRPPASA